MAYVKIVTDSTADIPKEIIKELDIEVIPLKVHFGEETYLDGVTIHPDQFYQKLPTAAQLPTTSQPSPVDFVDVYKKMVEKNGEDVQIISIHISAALSGTFQSANLAKSMLDDQLDITVIDSKRASYAAGILVVTLAKAAQEGKSKEECLDLAERLIQDNIIYFLVDTLQYLQKGGRIGKASAVLGSLLNIKPILSLDSEGVVTPVDKVRGNKKALAKIMQLLEEYAGDNEVNVGICHANAEQQAEEILAQIEQRFKVTQKQIANIGPVIGTHAGPQAIGITMTKVEA